MVYLKNYGRIHACMTPVCFLVDTVALLQAGKLLINRPYKVMTGHVLELALPCWVAFTNSDKGKKQPGALTFLLTALGVIAACPVGELISACFSHRDL